MNGAIWRVATLALTLPVAVRGQASLTQCARCVEWNVAQQPFRVFGNTYYVGTHGLSAILVTSPKGHVLIDGALPESAPQILANIKTLGFNIADVKLILNSHVHYDHAGGIAALQAATHARVVASKASASALKRGHSDRDDPQFGELISYAPVRNVHVVRDNEVTRVGSLELTPHATPGHTPGGTTWTWRSCEGDRCVDIVYADSQSPVAATGFRFTGSKAAADFGRGFATLESLPCDLLLTPHPEGSNLWVRIAARDRGDPGALIDPTACKTLVTAARARLAERMASEK